MNDYALHQLAKIHAHDIQREREHDRLVHEAVDHAPHKRRGLHLFARGKRNNVIK